MRNSVTRSGGSFLSAPASTQSVKLTANLFAGTGNPTLITGGFPVIGIVQTGHITSSASNIPGAVNVEQPDFWPNATLESQIRLSDTIDATYTHDAPRPLVLRTLQSGARMSGALQSAP